MTCRVPRLSAAMQLLAAALRSDPHDLQTPVLLDELVGRLSRRLLLILVVGGFAVAQMARSEAVGGAVGWWQRGLAGTALLGLVARLGWGPLRQLPPSMRPHIRGVVGRLDERDLLSGALLSVTTVLVVATTVLPAAPARWVGASLVLTAVFLFLALRIAGAALLAGRGLQGARRLVARRWGERVE